MVWLNIQCIVCHRAISVGGFLYVYSSSNCLWLMHAGRIEEASAVAARIGIAITKANRREVNDVNSSLGTKALWQRVNNIIKKPNESESGSKVTSEELNSH